MEGNATVAEQEYLEIMFWLEEAGLPMTGANIARAMQTGAWPGGDDVRLRIGLHRGRPKLTDTGYVGISVHAAARICFAAHGGQVVMSSAVRAALSEPPADGTSLKDLGAWRFRGLPEPVAMFQVEAADLQADFPPLRSAVRAD